MIAGWCSRTVRAAVFAAVCVLLAALGHVLMSGSHVPAWALAAGFAVTGLLGWCLAGRERGLPLIVAVVVAVQTVLHSAFSFAQSVTAGAEAGAPTAAGGLGHGMGAMHMGSLPMGSTHMGSTHMGSTHMGAPHMGSLHMHSMDMGHMAESHMGMGHMGMGHSMGGGTSSLGMFAAHLLAALLCGLWLACGEKAAFRILRAVAGWLAAPLRLLLVVPAAPDGPRVRLRRRRSHRAPRLLLLVHAIITRGPPAGTAVA
ncbi:hypothetical protein L0F81_19665 [Streptomyces tricolor]|uniref:Integral-membrane protein n=1 Tax=Streptomyces tricolor TaxID=68277 RepID=A0ABS9JIU9_9ACTN|nr:hypothetical protein [Streptomyces tricolor]MCG0065482.1 hypothetical protein [Streptomyces tricolor]